MSDSDGNDSETSPRECRVDRVDGDIPCVRKPGAVARSEARAKKPMLECKIVGGGDDECTYSTKNENAMRVHIRTQHTRYLCNYCMKVWRVHQQWYEHKEQFKNGRCRVVKKEAEAARNAGFDDGM